MFRAVFPAMEVVHRKEKMRFGKVFLTQSVGFMAIIALSWFDEFVGLRSLVFGDHPYISDFRESTLEMLFVFVVWLLVYGATRRMLTHVRNLEGFMRVCGWCRRIHCNNRWVPMEEFFLSSLDTRTSHGICSDCLCKQEAELEELIKRYQEVPPSAAIRECGHGEPDHKCR